uniref:Zinc finger homeobox 4 n=1 Tax=Cyprinus carpio TaxID=7962 RepID=A0A8C2I3Z8_CYPCA
MCCLCQRSFRTMQALRKHLETSHLELSETQIQQLYGSLMMNGETLISGDLTFGEEEGLPEETGMKDGEECDLEEKLSPADNDSSLVKDNVECDSKQPVFPIRKGPNITVEKFLDPSRPFKCTVCKESFTQKNILLVHYNSVSHLHKLKRSLQDTSTGLQEPVNNADHKPFKCSICNVAYSQSSTLEIHMRSVLHQTKARASKLDSSTSSTEYVGPPPGKALSNTSGTIKPATSLNNAGLKLQKKAALLQSHLFNPALLHPFPMATEALLPVQQQQQLLLPFLIPGGEFHMNPEVNLKGSGLSVSTLKPTVNEDTAESSKKDVPKNCSKQKLNEDFSIQPEMDEQKLTNDPSCHDAPGNASKALLENIGFELVMQYNENKEIYQKNVTEPIPNGGDKLECESCGKLFSNALILKSHKEQIHHSIFPIKSLEKFAKDYREQYDKLFPLRPATPEASPVSSPSPSPPAIPNSSAGLTPDLTQLYQQHNPPITTLEDVKVDSRPPSPEPTRQEIYGSKRSSRTRFTDYQLRLLQDFFDANAYPKDDEFEQLSNLLKLSTRVIVVWFQNARQKARKNYENQGEGCKKCNTVFQRIFDLIIHQKKQCYKDEEEQLRNDLNKTAVDFKTESPSQSSQTIFSPLEIPSTEQQQQQKPAQDMSPYHCIQCKLSFPSFEHWQEHLQMHFLTQSYFPTPPFIDRPVDMPLMLFDPANPLLASSMENDWENNGEEPQRDKRMRTTITPEQLEVLYQKYLLDSNPTRKMLDHISNEVGLKKRVVQVWFQNTRARERKGQFRALGPSQFHRRCPFCRALFKFLNSTDDSTACKSMDLSSHQQRLSPKPIKGEGMEDFEMPSVSVYQNPEQSKLNNCNAILDYSENSSLADPASPCPGSSSSQSFDNDRHSQKRYRTQMTNLQVKVLKACFSDYKTPTMLECEALGNDIGLAKRVVQVWFQNARAKEKKAKLSLAKQFGTESTSIDRPKTECTLCSVKYSGCLSIRDHVFSQQHLAKVKEALGGQVERDKEYLSPVSTCQLIVQQEVDHLKKTRDVLGITQPQAVLSSVGFNQTSLHCLSQSSMYSGLQAQTTASIPGGSSTMTEDFSSIKTGRWLTYTLFLN